MPRISQLPSLTAADNADELAIVDVSASTTKKITRGDLLKSPLPTNSVTTAAVANGSITATKLDFTTLNFGNYSTTEVDTGFKWIDGKTIYKKTVSFGALPNNTTKNVAHGITGLSWLICVDGMARTSAGAFTALNRTASTFLVYNVDSTNIIVTSNSDSSSYTTTYLTMLYTKA